MAENSPDGPADDNLIPVSVTGMSVEALNFRSENPEMPLFDAFPITNSNRSLSDQTPNTSSGEEKPCLSREPVRSPPLAHAQGIGEYARERIEVTSRLVIVLVTDAVLFLVWLATAWGVDSFAKYVHARGVNEYFAMAFVWISSTATLCLTVLYIFADLAKEYHRLFGSNPPQPRKAK